MNNRGISYAMSDQDIWNCLHGQARVMSYRESLKYQTIDSLLGPTKACVILYETSSNRGHWNCIFKRGNTISVFDSYGYRPDSQLEFIKPEFRAQSGVTTKHLSHLLISCPYELEYSPTPFQRSGAGISTCGRWCVLRLLNKGMTPEEFERRYYSSRGDENVVRLVP